LPLSDESPSAGSGTSDSVVVLNGASVLDVSEDSFTENDVDNEGASDTALFDDEDGSDTALLVVELDEELELALVVTGRPPVGMKTSDSTGSRVKMISLPVQSQPVVP
jgi:hypothetical protein